MSLESIPTTELQAEIDRRQKSPNIVDQVLGAVELVTGVNRSDILKRVRKKTITDARALVMWAILEKRPSWSLQAAAAVVGANCHGTAKNALKRVAASFIKNPELHAAAIRLREHLKLI